MSALLGALRAKAAYVFILAGAFWMAVAALAGSALLLWPVLACLAGGALLWARPGGRLTWAWSISTAVFGFLLAAYQVYAWAPFLGGVFSSVAAEGTAAFAVLALVHLLLIYLGVRPQPGAAAE